LGDRVGVICKGQLLGVVDRHNVDLTRIGLMMAGIEETSAASLEER
jgi:ABC-type uncharacterized transport system ATPase subunit